MTEEQWLVCADQGAMLHHLRGKISDRKARLFAVACCLRIAHLCSEPARGLVAVAERLADGATTVEELQAAAEPLAAAAEQATRGQRTPAKWAVRAAHDAARPAAWEAGLGTGPSAAFALSMSGQTRFIDALRQEEASQVALARCIFGNPFRPVAFDPAVQQWNGGCAVALATEMYEFRNFSKAPLLADMLEDAGVSDAQLLGHLRGPGPHARGCFAVDLVLGESEGGAP